MWPIQGVAVCMVFYLLCPANIIGLWWAVGSPLVMDPNRICRKSRRLGGRQREMCLKEPEIVHEVVQGVKMAIGECQFQFRYRKWNCSTSYRSFNKVLKLDTRETAYLYAMTAAGVVYSVTQACSTGLLNQCSCDNSYRDKTTDEKFEWGGCFDDVNYGIKKSREFMDDRRSRRKRIRRGDIRTLIHLHNNESGRQVVSNLTKVCKCHGLSGSCNLKTCWRKMHNFRYIGNQLKEQFDGAIQVIGSNDGRHLLPENTNTKSPGAKDLVYSEASPDFCNKSRKYGSLGTKGRQCRPNSKKLGSCDLLCCGRGYKKEVIIVHENCRCRFKYCCQVICETCVSVKTIYQCL